MNYENMEIKRKLHHNVIARVLEYDNTGYFYRGSINLYPNECLYLNLNFIIQESLQSDPELSLEQSFTIMIKSIV